MQPIQNNTTYSTTQEINEFQKQKPVANADNLTVQKQNPAASTDNSTAQKQQYKPIKDEYIPSDKETKQPTGLYQLKYSEDGTPKISFDNPRKKANNNKEANQEEKCTGNTDKVEQEIKKLKEEKKQLEQKLHTISDPQKIKELEKQLENIKQELQQKDNDTYRRQHTVFS